MKRTAVLLCSGLIAIGATGCPDGRTSVDPTTSASIARLDGEILTLRSELRSLETKLQGVEQKLDQKPVVVNVNTYGGGGGTGAAPPQQVTVDQADAGQPTGTGTSPQPTATPTAATGPAQLEQRSGKDAWNELNPAKPGEKPNRGGRVRVALSSQPDKLNTYIDNSAVTSYILNGYMFETLVAQNVDTFEFEPSLAKSWTTEDMLYEIKSAEPIEEVSFSQSAQKWTREDQTWWPWEIREASGGFELLTLAEHMGMAQQQGNGWKLTTQDGVVLFDGKDVARVNRGTVFTFNLRDDVKFHDGHLMDADDVVFSLDFIKCEYVDAPGIRSYYADVRPVEKLDSHTVRIVYEHQYFMAFEFAGGIYVHPKHVYDPQNLLETNPEAFGEWFNDAEIHRAPVGSGPYKFEKWAVQDSVTVKRNDDYWNPAKNGYLDQIVWKFIPESQAALASLREGSVDFYPTLSSEQFFKETDSKDFKSRFVKPIYYIGNYSYVGWNMRKPYFQDERVRRALAHGALDVPAFIKDVLYDAASPVAGSQFIFSPMYDQSVKPLSFDPEKARRLLREAGWFDRDGDGIIENADRVPFSFTLLLSQGSSTGPRMAGIMEENLRGLGIELKIQTLEWATFIENINSRDFDACQLGWVQSPNESDPMQIWHSSNAENRGSNHVGFGTPESDELILQIRETIDVEARRKLHGKFQKMLYGNQPYLFLFCSPNKAAYSPRFHGVRFISTRPGYDLLEWYLPEGN